MIAGSPARTAVHISGINVPVNTRAKPPDSRMLTSVPACSTSFRRKGAMGMRVCAAVCFVLAGALAHAAQDYSRFEVAAIRPSTLPPNLPPGTVPAPILEGGPGRTKPEHISFRYFPLRTLILKAFDVRNLQLVAPEWAGSGLFDITATLLQRRARNSCERCSDT